ncbi:hypothetical protein [Streptomyces sp. NBC_00842]|uniref:hypothetical protein n=1 Tax=Streptomyces sp. NBC_00842 TaxID=2975848 RepID=UPI003870B6E7|nr:hypothetical protein OH821_21930 [Streptomyces sp. NBC_00842]
MPEWALGALNVLAVAGFVCAVATRAAHHAARLVQRRSMAAEQAPLETFVRIPCHTTRCGHLQRRHDVTDRGLVCCRCGHVVRP